MHTIILTLTDLEGLEQNRLFYGWRNCHKEKLNVHVKKHLLISPGPWAAAADVTVVNCRWNHWWHCFCLVASKQYDIFKAFHWGAGKDSLQSYTLSSFVSFLCTCISYLMPVCWCTSTHAGSWDTHTGDTNTQKQVVRNAPAGSCDLMLFYNYNWKMVNLLLNLKKEIWIRKTVWDTMRWRQYFRKKIHKS